MSRVDVPPDDGGNYIREYYGVPAYIGGHVELQGRPAIITGFHGPHLMIHFTGYRWPVAAHPTWEMRYYDEES